MKTYVVNSKEKFDLLYPELKKSAFTGSTPATYLVGFDVEYLSKANFPESFNKSSSWITHYDKDHCNTCCLIQLATSDMCLVVNLVQLQQCIPNNLFNIITDECWIKVGVGIELDLKHLSLNYGLNHCSGGVEIRNLALMANYKTPNLEYMFNRFVGFYVKQKSGVSDWSQPLTESDVVYAARDAIMSYQIFKKIMEPTIDYMVKVEEECCCNVLNLDIQYDTDNINNTVKEESYNTDTPVNYVGRLNELLQKHSVQSVKYTVTKVNKRPPEFKVTGNCTSLYEEATASSIMLAKQTVAKLLLQKIDLKI